MFIDEVKISVKAGNGGDGCMGFRREKFIPKGGPDGGDGGNGGDVIAVCDENTSDLTAYRYNPIWTAKNGENGRGRQQHGKSGESIRMKFPIGTVFYDADTEEVVAELTKHGQEIILLHGGRGGLGNIHFKSSVNQAPQETTPGEAGEEQNFHIVIKTVADVGLVGFPNAGKSSITNLVTNAHPKVGNYPFTTLFPQVGIIEYPDDYDRVSIADIPGLIKGANENKGLGHRFLRHIERCGLLVFMIDMSGNDGRDPWDDYADLLNELKLYDKALAKKPHLVAANKMDEPASEKNLKTFKTKFKKAKVFPISCLSEEGIEALKKEILKQVKKIREQLKSDVCSEQ